MAQVTISPQVLDTWLREGDEIAVLDLRSEEEFGKGAPLYATNLPGHLFASQIERYVPRRAVRTVLVDGGDGSAQIHAAWLREQGWPDVHALHGGIPNWIASTSEPRPTFDIAGVDFSLAVRSERGTPVISASDLIKLRASKADVIVLDTRTVPEFEAGHVPGAVSVPGAELLLRFDDLVPSPDTFVVVSCAGLPRAILGAQTLIDANVPNRVAYLDDGTRAWLATGGVLEAGRTALFGPASRSAQTAAARRAELFLGRDAIPQIDLATALQWQADPERTTFLLDVRTPEEFDEDHLPQSLSSPGGQLLGVSHRTIAVRKARVVLIDDTLGARAAVAAHWLRRRGFEIAVLKHTFAADALRSVA